MIGDSQDLRKASDPTLEYYNRRAERFRQGKRDHDVSRNVAALLRYIEGVPPFTLLDFGCGPGRDLEALATPESGIASAAMWASDPRPYFLIAFAP
jgi:hypothetical protein